MELVRSQIALFGESIIPARDDDIGLVGDDRFQRRIPLDGLMQVVDDMRAVLGSKNRFVITQ